VFKLWQELARKPNKTMDNDSVIYVHETYLAMRYLSSISLAVVVHVLLSIVVLMILACTATPANSSVKETATGLEKPFLLSDDIDSQHEALSIFLGYQRQHPVMHNWGDKLAQSNAPMSETHFALRPEALDHCEYPTLRDYQEVLKKYDPGSGPPSIFRWDNSEELRNRIVLVSQLLSGDSVDYKAAGLKKCHLDVLRDMFESTYAQGRVVAYPIQISTVGAPEMRIVMDEAVARSVSQFVWEYPDGTTPEGLKFLPYALETNLSGINAVIGN
jgi:hypothetical protein